MDAAGTCDMLINSVKSSNLNYYLNETPFQVTITIKKTFVQRYNTKESSNIIHDPLSIFSQLEGQGKGGIAPQWQVPKLESASAADQMENGSNPLWLTPPPPTRQSALKLNDISASARDLNAASMEIKSTPDYLKHKYKPEEQDTGTNCSTYHAQLNTKQGLITSAMPTVTIALPTAKTEVKNKVKKSKAQVKKLAKQDAEMAEVVPKVEVDTEKCVPLSEAYPEVSPADIERTKKEFERNRKSGATRGPGFPPWFGKLGEQDDHQAPLNSQQQPPTEHDTAQHPATDTNRVTIQQPPTSPPPQNQPNSQLTDRCTHRDRPMHCKKCDKCILCPWTTPRGGPCKCKFPAFYPPVCK